MSMTTPNEFTQYGNRLAIALFKCARFDHRNGGPHAEAAMKELTKIAREFGKAVASSKGLWTAEEWGDAVHELMSGEYLIAHRERILALMHY